MIDWYGVGVFMLKCWWGWTLLTVGMVLGFFACACFTAQDDRREYE